MKTAIGLLLFSAGSYLVWKEPLYEHGSVQIILCGLGSVLVFEDGFPGRAFRRLRSFFS